MSAADGQDDKAGKGDAKHGDQDTNESGTQLYRAWLLSLSDGTPGFNTCDPLTFARTSALDVLSEYDKALAKSQALEQQKVKIDEAVDNGFKTLVSAIISMTVAVVTYVDNRTVAALITVIGTLAPVIVGLYLICKGWVLDCMLSKNRKKSEETREQLSILVQKQMWALSNTLGGLRSRHPDGIAAKDLKDDDWKAMQLTTDRWGNLRFVHQTYVEVNEAKESEEPNTPPGPRPAPASASAAADNGGDQKRNDDEHTGRTPPLSVPLLSPQGAPHSLQ